MKGLNEIIEYLNLEEFWKNLSYKEKMVLTRYAENCIEIENDNKQIFHSSNNELTVFNLLNIFIDYARLEKRWGLLDKLIYSCENHIDEASSITKLHFYYMKAANVYYDERSLRDDAEKRAIYFCKKDIDIAEDVKKEMMKRFSDIANHNHREPIHLTPYYPSFKQLAIIFEKSGYIDEAIEICKLAINLGFLDDKTKGGMKERLTKLEKKKIAQSKKRIT